MFLLKTSLWKLEKMINEYTMFLAERQMIISEEKNIWKHKAHFCDGYLKRATWFSVSHEKPARLARRQPLSDFINKCQPNLQMSRHLTPHLGYYCQNFAENNIQVDSIKYKGWHPGKYLFFPAPGGVWAHYVTAAQCRQVSTPAMSDSLSTCQPQLGRGVIVYFAWRTIAGF